MRTKNFLLTLSLLASTSTSAATPQEQLVAAREKHLSFVKAFADYSSKYDYCTKNEKTKPPLQSSDISFLTKAQARTILLKMQKQRISRCIYHEENIAIRKHIEILSLLRFENVLPVEREALDQSLDFYSGLEDGTDHRVTNKYELIPEVLRERFDRASKGKSLEVHIFDITESLPE